MTDERHPKYPTLLSPIKVGQVELRNRTLMGSMHTGLEEVRGGFERLAKYFAERARGEVGIIVTGGVAPNREGWVKPFSAKLTKRSEAKKHRLITDAVHREGGLICLQILHSGRYGYHPLCVSPSATKSPISWFKARAMSKRKIEKTIQSCPLRCLAQRLAMTASKSWGQRATSFTSLSRPAPISETMNGVVNMTIESPALRSAKILYSSSASQCSIWWKPAAPGTGRISCKEARRIRGVDHQHRHRLARSSNPHHRHHGAPGKLHVGDRKAQR